MNKITIDAICVSLSLALLNCIRKSPSELAEVDPIKRLEIHAAPRFYGPGEPSRLGLSAVLLSQDEPPGFISESRQLAVIKNRSDDAQ